MDAELKRTVEALLFAAPEPLTLGRLKAIVPGSDKRTLRAVLGELASDYDEAGHAFQLAEIGGGWRVVTRPGYTRRIEELLKGQRRVRLSKPALECLSVIAYRQPCTRIDVEKVRGVNCGGSIATLLERGLIRISGRAESLGRPLLYGTSEAFLAHLGINSLDDLPQMVEIEALLSSGGGEEASGTAAIASEERRERLYAGMDEIAAVIAESEASDGENGNGNGNGNGAGEAADDSEPQESDGAAEHAARLRESLATERASLEEGPRLDPLVPEEGALELTDSGGEREP